MFFASQVFGFLGFCFVLIAMSLKVHRKLLFYKLISTFFILLSYVFIGSLAGILIAVVSFARGVIAIGITYKNNVKLKKLSIYFLCVLTIALNLIFWKSGLNVLSILISLISIFCFFQTQIFYIRSISILVSILEIILNIIILNPINIVIEIFTISSCAYGILKHDCFRLKVKIRRH